MGGVRLGEPGELSGQFVKDEDRRGGADRDSSAEVDTLGGVDIKLGGLFVAGFVRGG